jgi:TolB-like protein/DNA-binding winged helix-turn-helix (wHTH) protein
METTENKRFVYEFGKFILDPQEKTLFENGIARHLPAKEFETLLLLVENNGKALTKDEMMTAIWQDAFVEESNLAKQISRLRKIFNSNGEKFIETLPKHGYRFKAELHKTEQVFEEPVILEKRTVKRMTVKLENEFDGHPLALPPPKSKFLTAPRLAVFSLIVLLGVISFWIWNEQTKTAKINSIAVLPLKSLTAEENNKALGLGLADALITKIGSLRVISVRPTSAVVKFAETDADALEIGKKLNVDAVLEGTIQQSEGRLRINARLLKTADGEQIWAENFDQPASEIFALQDALSGRIAKTLAFELSKSQFAELASRPTENPEAFEKYLRGRFYQSQNNEQGLTRSIEFYEQAIALDAGFAEPYAGIADAYLILYNFSLRSPDEVIPRIKQNLNRAMQLNPNLSQAHLTAAQLAFLYEHDSEKAGKFYQKSVELNPNNADAFLRYGYFLTFLGRFDEALFQLEKSRELNPISSLVQANIGLVYLSRRDYPAAIEQLNKTIAENPEVSIPHWFLGASYEANGDAKKGLAENLLALRLEGEPELAARLETINQTDGEQAAYQAWFDEMLKVRKNGFVPAIQIAFLAAVLRDRTATLDWLEKAAQENDAILWQIKYVARYDFVRDDERFKRLVENINLQSK